MIGRALSLIMLLSVAFSGVIFAKDKSSETSDVLKTFQDSCDSLATDDSQQALRNLNDVDSLLQNLKSDNQNDACSRALANADNSANASALKSILSTNSQIASLNKQLNAIAEQLQTTSPTDPSYETLVEDQSELQSEVMEAQMQTTGTESAHALEINTAMDYIDDLRSAAVSQCGSNLKVQGKVLGNLISVAGQFSGMAEVSGQALALTASIASDFINGLKNQDITSSLNVADKAKAEIGIGCAIQRMSDALCGAKKEKDNEDLRSNIETCYSSIFSPSDYLFRPVMNLSKNWADITKDFDDLHQINKSSVDSPPEGFSGSQPGGDGRQQANARLSENILRLKDDLTTLRDYYDGLFGYSVMRPPLDCSKLDPSSCFGWIKGIKCTMDAIRDGKLEEQNSKSNFDPKMTDQEKQVYQKIESELGTAYQNSCANYQTLQKAIDALSSQSGAIDGNGPDTDQLVKNAAAVLGGYNLHGLVASTNVTSELQTFSDRVFERISAGASIAAPVPMDQKQFADFQHYFRDRNAEALSELQEASFNIALGDTGTKMTQVLNSAMDKSLNNTLTLSQTALKNLTPIVDNLNLAKIFSYLDENGNENTDVGRAFLAQKKDLCLSSIALDFSNDKKLQDAISSECAKQFTSPSFADLRSESLEDRACYAHNERMKDGVTQIMKRLSPIVTDSSVRMNGSGTNSPAGGGMVIGGSGVNSPNAAGATTANQPSAMGAGTANQLNPGGPGASSGSSGTGLIP